MERWDMLLGVSFVMTVLHAANVSKESRETVASQPTKGFVRPQRVIRSSLKLFTLRFPFLCLVSCHKLALDDIV